MWWAKKNPQLNSACSLQIRCSLMRSTIILATIFATIGSKHQDEGFSSFQLLGKVLDSEDLYFLLQEFNGAVPQGDNQVQRLCPD